MQHFASVSRAVSRKAISTVRFLSINIAWHISYQEMLHQRKTGCSTQMVRVIGFQAIVLEKPVTESEKLILLRDKLVRRRRAFVENGQDATAALASTIRRTVWTTRDLHFGPGVLSYSASPRCR
jgi:hypothetical protein